MKNYLDPTLIESASANVTEGNAVAHNLNYAVDEFSWQCILAATISALTVTVQGTIDGTNWFDLDSNNEISDYLRGVKGDNIPLIRQIRAYTADYAGTGAYEVKILIRLRRGM